METLCSQRRLRIIFIPTCAAAAVLLAWVSAAIALPPTDMHAIVHNASAYIEEGQFAQPNRVERTVVCMNTIRTPEPAAALRIVSHHVAVGAQQPKALVEIASLV
jgi:hypothetical protein